MVKKSELTKKRKSYYRKTIKKTEKDYKAHITKVFLELLNMIKLYHWNTRSYGQHEATDKLYESLNIHIDEFIEVLIGKYSKRIHLVSKKSKLIVVKDGNEFREKLHEYIDFLNNLDKVFPAKKNSDILSIRDQIIIDINKFLYLMTFDD
jgi:DNA-binding ferritin-like protein